MLVIGRQIFSRVRGTHPSLKTTGWKFRGRVGGGRQGGGHPPAQQMWISTLFTVHQNSGNSVAWVQMKCDKPIHSKTCLFEHVHVCFMAKCRIIFAYLSLVRKLMFCFLRPTCNQPHPMLILKPPQCCRTIHCFLHLTSLAPGNQTRNHVGKHVGSLFVSPLTKLQGLKTNVWLV